MMKILFSDNFFIGMRKKTPKEGFWVWNQG